MGIEIQVNSMEETCDNKLPKQKNRAKKNKYLFNDQKQTPDGMVSVSQLQTFMSCKKKWAYNYLENLKPRVERSYLTIGKLCHKGMQAAMNMLWMYPLATLEQMTVEGLTAMQKEYSEYMAETDFLDEELPDMEQLWEDAESVFKQALKEFNPTKYEVITIMNGRELLPALELHFVVPCAPTKGLHGFIDAILKDKETGFVWSTDYKFRKSLSPDDEEAYNVQNAVYVHACRMLGVEITGTMTWQHVNTPASDPAINKDGTVSTAKIKTTWEHYKQFLIEHGKDPSISIYAAMEEKLSGIEWFRPTYEYRNNETVENIWSQCVLPAASAVKKAHNKNANNYRSLYPWNCKMCQYQSICQAELRDYDADAIREREYTRRVSPLPSLVSENVKSNESTPV